MQNWNLAEAELLIALRRTELNSFLLHRKIYDTQKHNICLAILRLRNGTTEVLTAYSHSSAIAESTRLALDLVPSLYDKLPIDMRFGCDGMGAHHTEPKLLNYICSSPEIRRKAAGTKLPADPLYRAVLTQQREAQRRRDERIGGPGDLCAVLIVSEIDCCTTCTRHAIDRFRSTFPRVALDTLELGRNVALGRPPQYKRVIVTAS